MKTVMKLTLKLAFVSLMLLTVNQKSYSNFSRDTLIRISIENFKPDPQNHLTRFDIYLIRTSDVWHLWENATFQIEFLRNGGVPIDYENYEIEVDVSRSEIVTTYTGTPVYQIGANILNDANNPANSRVMLIVLGPEDPVDSKVFAEFSKLKLCTVILKPKNSNTPLTTRIEWKEPFDYYQAIAYKYIDQVNSVPDYVIVANENDHIEMIWNTVYDTILPLPETQLRYFEVEYTGNLNVVCRYATMAEHNNAGFVIRRAVYRDTLTQEGYEALPDSIFTVTVGDYRDPVFTSRMQGLGESRFGKEYDPIPDEIDNRMVNYVYRLFYEHIDDEDGLHKIATRNLITPNAVIFKATASPNPCRDISYIEYKLDDDVYLTCEVYDQNGKKIKTLSDDVNGLLYKTYVPRGTYTAVFDATDLASQGFYNVIFIAYPINDKNVEISTASVKVQLIRGYGVEQP